MTSFSSYAALGFLLVLLGCAVRDASPTPEPVARRWRGGCRRGSRQCRAGWILVPLFVGGDEEQTSDLTVMTSNLQFGRGDAAAVVRLVAAENVDVLVLEEVTPKSLDRPGGGRARRAAAAPSREARRDGGGTMVFSRYPLTTPRPLTLGKGGVDVRVAAPDPFRLLAVHAVVPAGAAAGQWLADLRVDAHAHCRRGGPEGRRSWWATSTRLTTTYRCAPSCDAGGSRRGRGGRLRMAADLADNAVRPGLVAPRSRSTTCAESHFDAVRTRGGAIPRNQTHLATSPRNGGAEALQRGAQVAERRVAGQGARGCAVSGLGTATAGAVPLPPAWSAARHRVLGWSRSRQSVRSSTPRCTQLGGQERPGQVAMAEAVAEAMQSRRHLLVQAGTGTGKSLGYLVPALLHDDRVVVATATLALQHQLVERDIPALLEAAERAARRAAVVRRAQGAVQLRLPAPRPRGRARRPGRAGRPARGVAGRRGAGAARVGRGGGEGGRHRRARPRAPAHRPGLAAGQRQPPRVPRREPSARTAPSASPSAPRSGPRRSQLIVTNHSLLAIDAIEGVPMIPEYDVVVIDEAHELVSRVTQAATDELSVPEIDRTARRAQRHVEGTEADDLADAGDALRDAIDDRGARPDRPRARGARPTRWPWSATPPARWSRRSPRRRPRARARPTPPRPRRRAGRRSCSRPPSGWRRARTRTSSGSRARRDRNRGGNHCLCVAPLEVAGPMREKLLAEKTAVFTSATLKLGGDFDAVATSIGLSPADRVTDGLDRRRTARRRTGRRLGGPRRRLAVRLRPAGDPLRRPAPAAAGPRRADPGAPRRDRRAGRRRRRPHPRAVLEPAGRGGRRRARPRGAAAPDHAGPGRRPAARAGAPVRRRPAHQPVRHAQPVAGPRRAGGDLPAGDHRPDPVPAPRRPADVGAAAGGRQGRRQRVHDRRRHPRRAAARAGLRAADPHDHRPRRGGRASTRGWSPRATAPSCGRACRRCGRPTTRPSYARRWRGLAGATRPAALDSRPGRDRHRMAASQFRPRIRSAAWVRSRTWSLASTLATWFCTVFRLSPSSRAISALLRPRADQREHLRLPPGEVRVGPGARSQQAGGDAGAEDRATAGDGADRRQHLVLAGVLEQVAAGADPHGRQRRWRRRPAWSARVRRTRAPPRRSGGWPPARACRAG